MSKNYVTLERLKRTMNYKVTEKKLNRDNDKERFNKNIQPYLVKFDDDYAQPKPIRQKKRWTEFDKFALVFFVILLIVIFLKNMYL